MKCIKLITAVLFLACLASCGGDDCGTADWAGTWNGELSCDDGTTEMTTVIIRAIDENTIIFSIDGDETEVNVTGCSFVSQTQEDTFLGLVDLQVDGSLNGDQLDFDVTTSLIGFSLNCTANFTRG